MDKLTIEKVNVNGRDMLRFETKDVTTYIPLERVFSDREIGELVRDLLNIGPNI